MCPGKTPTCQSVVTSKRVAVWLLVSALAVEWRNLESLSSVTAVKVTHNHKVLRCMYEKISRSPPANLRVCDSTVDQSKTDAEGSCDVSSVASDTRMTAVCPKLRRREKKVSLDEQTKNTKPITFIHTTTHSHIQQQQLFHNNNKTWSLSVNDGRMEVLLLYCIMTVINSLNLKLATTTTIVDAMNHSIDSLSLSLSHVTYSHSHTHTHIYISIDYLNVVSFILYNVYIYIYIYSCENKLFSTGGH